MRKRLLVVMIAAIVGMSAAAVDGLTQRGRGRGRGQAPPLDVREVADGLYVIVGSGGNVSARVTSEGVILIDDKFERNYDEIIERIQGVTASRSNTSSTRTTMVITSAETRASGRSHR